MKNINKTDCPAIPEGESTNIFELFDRINSEEGKEAALTAVYDLGRSFDDRSTPFIPWTQFEPMVQTMERLHSLVIAMTEAISSADETNRQAIEFSPGMRFIDEEMHGLLTSMQIALSECRGLE